MQSLKKVAVAVSLAFGSAAYGSVAEKPSALADQQSVAVTIYNENLALVKDQRRVGFEAGRNRLATRGERPDAEDRAATQRCAPGSLTLLEQNFDFDLLTRLSCWKSMSDARCASCACIRRRAPSRSRTAFVLAANNGVVMRIGDRIETGLPGRIVYDGVPAAARPAHAHQRARRDPRRRTGR